MKAPAPAVAVLPAEMRGVENGLSTSARRLMRVGLVTFAGAALAVLVALCVPTWPARDVLFGGHNEDPSMPAPLLGGDDDAMPGVGAGEWGGVGAGGTFLGRNMAKRRRIISDQGDLWKKAEEGIGNLVAMSKGQWHPGPVHERRGDLGQGGRSRDEASWRSISSSGQRGAAGEEGRAEMHHVGLDVGGGHGGRESELGQRRERRASDERRSLLVAVPPAGTPSAPAAGHDVEALRTAIFRMKHALGSTKERLERAVRQDENRARRLKEQRAAAAMRIRARTSLLTASAADGEAHDESPATPGRVKYDAMGHKIEWPLLAKAQVEPSDTDEASETITDSLSGLQKMVGAVEDDVHGLLEKTARKVHSAHSKTSLQFRRRWGAVAGQLARTGRDASSQQLQSSSKQQDAQNRPAQRSASPPSTASDHERAPAPQARAASRLSALAERRQGLGSARPASASRAPSALPREATETEMSNLEAAVADIENRISRLAVQERSTRHPASDGGEGTRRRGQAGRRSGGSGGDSQAHKVPYAWDRDDASGRQAFKEAARASERAASLLSDSRLRGQYGAVYPSPPAGDSEDSEGTREGELDDAPPSWALYAHGEQAEEGDDDVNEHYASDASPRDAYRRQLAHMVRTTSPGSTFQLPTDVIDSQVRARMPEMRAQGPRSASHAPSLLFAAPASGDMLRSRPARTQDLAALPAMMMGRAERGGVQGTGVPVPTAVLGTGYEAIEEHAVAPLDSASGVVYVMGRSKAHELEAGGAVRLQSSSGDKTHTTQLAMSSQAPFSLPAIKWVPPPVPLTEEQQEWETEKQALAAVDSAIPRIAKAGKMVQQVKQAAEGGREALPGQDVFYR